MTSSKFFYADWRTRQFVPGFRERDGVPPEKLLQAIWQHQRLRRDQLNTSNGQSLRVLHPGFKNHEAGPDFRRAVLQFGDAPPCSGDVEIDLSHSGWHAHGHDRNPDFKKVILHVVWDLDRPASARPGLEAGFQTLGLRNVLDAPLCELDSWFGGEAMESLPEVFVGSCCSPLRGLPEEKITDLLHQAAHVRLQSKAAWFSARAKQAGWEQALWEGLFRALGYKQNVWPMQRLAELRSRLIAGNDRSPLALQARLLGVSGLLPSDLMRAQLSTDNYLRRIWDLWWRERDGFADVVLPRAVWKFNGLRPANHPQRRVALASHWLTYADFMGRLGRWGVAGDARPEEALLNIFQVEQDEFWSWHWTLRSTRMNKPQPLLGGTRLTDLAINVILPWLWSRAKESDGGKLKEEIERRFFSWPVAEDNSLLKLARQRLLGGAGRSILQDAAAQQGLLQIVRDFCEHSNALCDRCGFPDLVRVWKTR